ncbi:MFS transporter [Spiroplasma endosymbiont of Virgichneumon dumeticola]|uniref:MFS transporter n=1 Tax=Spiroplasma endosymbiont of Virgichneumon dumeticola TaxID=3139323 RepID=UPI0035C94150
MNAFNKLAGIFKPPAAKELFSEDSKVINRKYAILRNQILAVTIITYILYYFTRKAFTLANGIAIDNGYATKVQMSMVLMFFSITYGCSKFIIGNFADRSSGRTIMTLGLLGAAIVNIALGGTIVAAGSKITIGPIITMIILMVALGVFQGMGWPAVARMFSNWYTSEERSKKIAIWNTGGAMGTALLPFIIVPIVLAISVSDSLTMGFYFWIPSILALIMVPFCWWGLRDNPESQRLPSIEKWKGVELNDKEKQELNWKEIFTKYILKNKYVWILAFANIWVYVIRQGMSTWMLNMAADVHGVKIVSTESSVLWSTFEWAGLAGGILAAYSCKWFFQNRTAPLMVMGLALAGIGIIMFQFAPHGNEDFLIVALFVAGFGIYIPKTLIGAAAIQLTNKKAAATASGFTGLFGYLGDAVFSAPVVAVLAPNRNWDNVFYYFYGCIIVAIIALALLWTKNEKNKIL